LRGGSGRDCKTERGENDVEVWLVSRDKRSKESGSECCLLIVDSATWTRSWVLTCWPHLSLVGNLHHQLLSRSSGVLLSSSFWNPRFAVDNNRDIYPITSWDTARNQIQHTHDEEASNRMSRWYGATLHPRQNPDYERNAIRAMCQDIYQRCYPTCVLPRRLWSAARE
jgi:hypothetical protein